MNWTSGWEQLGGDGTRAFQTPLATLHAFNGWADKFLVTPGDGLEDRQLAAEGNAVYGREWNASLAFPLHGRLTGLVKLADYRSDGFARDTRKLWFQIESAWP